MCNAAAVSQRVLQRGVAAQASCVQRGASCCAVQRVALRNAAHRGVQRNASWCHSAHGVVLATRRIVLRSATHRSAQRGASCVQRGASCLQRSASCCAAQRIVPGQRVASCRARPWNGTDHGLEHRLNLKG
jgi:hypothetical protein